MRLYRFLDFVLAAPSPAIALKMVKAATCDPPSIPDGRYSLADVIADNGGNRADDPMLYLSLVPADADVELPQWSLPCEVDEAIGLHALADGFNLHVVAKAEAWANVLGDVPWFANVAP